MTAPRSTLPGVLAEIAEVAGIEAAWAIARAHGGRSIYIPAHAPAGHWLAELVGLDAAARICKHFRYSNSGREIVIPIARQAEQRRRLYQALASGMTAAEAAGTAGMHERSAFRARRRLKDDDDSQGELF